MKIRTVQVELLRAGPPHNQLLSPLTQYLGVCGESGAGVVTLPYEQYQFDRRLRQLRYEQGTEDDLAWRRELLRDTGTEMGRLLGAVPGLAGSLVCEDPAETLTHLRLVLSASELAQLPWELARVPAGAHIPAESWLLLQGLSPLCLTRHIRSVPTSRVEWPTQPRLLVVAGDPQELPLDDHLDALYDALEPWLEPPQPGDERRPWPARGTDWDAAEPVPGPSWVTFCVDATVQKVERLCAQAGRDKKPYTHVHVLAHGAEDESAEDTVYGLLLKDAQGDPDVASGERFASALGSAGVPPAVVTLATCDSANVGEVKTPGASFAHTLHQAGVPLVVASQFPLSMEGSVNLVRTLYKGLLWGENPLPLLQRIRTELHSVYADRSHDWASLVVYEALPPNLEEQLRSVEYACSRRALDAALKDYQEAVEGGGSAPGEEVLAQLLQRVERARGRLPATGPYAMEGLGLSAASRKRQAEVQARLGVAAGSDEEEADRCLGACRELLEDAYEEYRQAVIDFVVSSGKTLHRKASLHWVLVQTVALATVLGEELGEEHWMTGRLSAELYLDHEDVEERAWAHGSLAELWLLRLAGLEPAQRAEAAGRVLQHAGEVRRLFPRRGEFPVESTRRQFQRYVDWWGGETFSGYLQRSGVERSGWNGDGGVVETARAVVALLSHKGRPPARRRAAAKGLAAGGGGRTAAKTAGAKAAGGKTVGAKTVGGKTVGAKTVSAKATTAKRLGKRSRRGGGEPVFELEMVQADYGDCLWIEYGDAADRSRVLVDCGPTSTFPRLKAKVEALAKKERRFELFVLTHIDADHIGGTIPFFKDETLGVSFGDVWFNGWKHLPMNQLGAKQGEIFSTLVRDRELPWNAAADGGPMMVGKDELPVYTLPGGMKLTLLSPTRDRLAKLRTRWQKELKHHGLTPGSKVDYRKFLGGTRTTSTDVDALADGRFKADVTPPNGSSIAFLAEFEGKSALLAADAHVPVMVDSLKLLLHQRGEERLRCDLFKLSHHASQGNTSSELVQLVDCDRFLVSTSGARFHHPDRETVARVIKYGGERPDVCFNYRSKDNEVWARDDLQERYGYRALFPEEGEESIKVSL